MVRSLSLIVMKSDNPVANLSHIVVAQFKVIDLTLFNKERSEGSLCYMFVLNFFSLLSLILAWLICFRCYWVVQMMCEMYAAIGHIYIEWEQCLSTSRTLIDASKPHLENIYKVLFIFMFGLNWSPTTIQGIY